MNFYSRCKNIYAVIFCFCVLRGAAAGTNEIRGGILAFADVNADRFTDLIVKTGVNTITAYLASDKDASFKEDERYRHTFPSNTTVVNAAVGDFNGDSFPDLVVSMKYDSNFRVSDFGEKGCPSGGVYVEVCYGSPEKYDCRPLNKSVEGGGTQFASIFCEQPLVLDCNVDQRSDLLTSLPKEKGSEFVCYKASKERWEFDLIRPFPDKEHSFSPMNAPTSHAFVDVTGDLNPEIVLWTEPTAPNILGMKVLRLTDDNEWTPIDDFIPPLSPPKISPALLQTSATKDERRVFGRSVFDDFNRDGLVDHLVPYCPNMKNGKCAALQLAVCAGGAWNWMDVSLVDSKQTKWVVVPENLGDKDDSPHSFNLRSGDYTQDGYPDLLIVLQQNIDNDASKPTIRRAYLLENVDCPAGENCGAWSRTFRVSWSAFGGDSASSVGDASFFDVNEDGALNVLLEYSDASSGTQLQFAKSEFESDTTFLKVEVYTATCLGECLNGKEGTAISLPGAALTYVSSDTDGKPTSGSYTQRSVSSYRSLLLPYAIFGLGRTPNFVEKLKVGIPTWPLCNTSWQQLVPNSRIYVIPYPPGDPSRWVHRLFVTPGRLIIYSFISLSSVCALIIIIVFALHMKERQMDKKERELQRERFHFDAM